MKKLLVTSLYTMICTCYGTHLLAGIEIANPASQLCNELGGESKTYKIASGDSLSLCAFKDDKYLYGLIEEWTLFGYKTSSESPSQAIQGYLKHEKYQPPQDGTVGNPASHYCSQIGGQTVLIEDEDGNESGLCEFDDGSQIEEWTLFRGPQVHKGLTKVLQEQKILR